uniref:Uncharacterized protein n=1 Tax=Rhizophora mucronata TaxID=61149 RepID=A0A2P2N5L0_RHIMU
MSIMWSSQGRFYVDCDTEMLHFIQLS